MDHLGDMLAFARVVEAESFSAAARQLGLSKAAVSKQVTRLENRLGVRLLNRSTRRLALTEVGAAFYERCQRIAGEVEAAEEVATRLQHEPRGTLKLSAPMSFGMLHIAPAIPEFLARYPHLRIEMTMNDRVVDLIEEGFDLAIRISTLADSSLMARRLAANRRVVCASPDYLARAGTPRTPQDLTRHNCIGYSYLATPNEWRFVTPDGPLTIKVRGNLEVNNGDAIRSAVLNGLGIALIPTFIVGEDLRAGRLACLLREYRGADTAIHAVWPHGRLISAKVRALVDFMAERFGGEEPYWDRGI